MNILIGWLGRSDLNEPDGGAVASAVKAEEPDEVVVLSSHPAQASQAWAASLRRRTRARVLVHQATLRGPTDLTDIHHAATAAIRDTLERHPRKSRLTLLLSGGTPAMAAVFIILGKTRYPSRFLETSRGHGVRQVEVPFSLSAELLPDLLRAPDAELERLAGELPPATAEFDGLVHRSTAMRRLLARARRVALRSVPVLVEGESGTGKELLARALHQASPRRAQPFVAVNCGAIPEALVESELFGHEKGAFTGALAARLGHFREAHGGTLFLDEIGELPRAAQVKLLRTLQEGEVTAVGSSRAVAVDVRIIAASNRTLLHEVAAGRFRSDLYYRLAVAVLVLPPLRERTGDLDLLLDHGLKQINAEFAADPGYEPKRLTPAARAALHAHAWPGNVRELMNTLRRAALWTPGATVQGEDAREALLSAPSPLEVTAGEIDLPSHLAEIARRHLARALDAAGGNKSRAAAALGLASHQTLTNWIRRYGLATAR
jgi:transcriptional regulator with PAS, ATPase and Fis domain